jgi:HTH-type transcriptional regulator/antitoxin HigA
VSCKCQHSQLIAAATKRRPFLIEAITYYLESRGLSRRDLEPYLGSRARVSEVLNRKRPLTLDMIRRLHANLGISAEVLIQPYATTKAAA